MCYFSRSSGLLTLIVGLLLAILSCSQNSQPNRPTSQIEGGIINHTHFDDFLRHGDWSGENTFLLVFIPCDSPQKRVILRRFWNEPTHSDSPSRMDNSNLAELTPSITLRFLVDRVDSSMMESDLIVTIPKFHHHSSQGIHSFIFPKMRTALIAAQKWSYSFLLWCDDDMVANKKWVMSTLKTLKSETQNYHNLYMGIPLKGNKDNGRWNPEYLNRLALTEYPTYMHGSLIIFGNKLFSTFAAMDHFSGLHFYGFGDVTFGIWTMALNTVYSTINRPLSVTYNYAQQPPPNSSLCSKYAFIHPLKELRVLEDYSNVMRLCEEEPPIS